MGDIQRLLYWLEQSNQVAATTSLGELARQVVNLLVTASRAQVGCLYVLDAASGELVCKACHGVGEVETRGEQRLPIAGSFAGMAWQRGETVWLPRGVQDQAWVADLHLPRGFAPGSAYALPLCLRAGPVGVVTLYELDAQMLELLPPLADRLAPDIERALHLEAAQESNRRLEDMVRILGRIGATLDRDEILREMIGFAREVIDAEAASLFLVDKTIGDIVLHLTSNVQNDQSLEQVRVPAGKGIIGHVVATGETVLVPDVSRDPRHYSGVDQSSGFVTRAILAVALQTREVVLGGERGTMKAHVIGGFEALNKLEGTFDQEDVQLMQTLANQAATVLEIASLYSDANELFLDVIKALTASIDAKDPTTEGHSQRVSRFSVEIARELGWSAEDIHRLHIGSLLHDVGKIGIPDPILQKPGKLTDEEYTEMKKHPTIGANIMSQVRMLQNELPALSQHHERLDGSGYPLGLKGDEISWHGRIVAAADVFDALTSKRPYREALSANEALDYLQAGVGRLFDHACVDALVKAYVKGTIETERERKLREQREDQAAGG